jgi:hypothetical protein
MVAREERGVRELNSPPAETVWRTALVVLLAMAFGYIEAAVVVYLRRIFHPAGFSFPLDSSLLASESGSLLLVEVAREAATIVLIACAALLSGKNRSQRLAYFLLIFAVWDIFYYVWLRVTLGWPGSVMDWDVLFLIPLPWAGPVLAPVLVSLLMVVIAGAVLYRDVVDRPLGVSRWDLLGYFLSGLVIITSFCIAGGHTAEHDYAAHFSWLVFAVGFLAAAGISAKCFWCNGRSRQLPDGKQAGVP